MERLFTLLNLARPCRRNSVLRALALALLTAGSVTAQAVRCDTNGIGPAAFRRVLNGQFATLVNARNAATPGTFGAYNFKDGTVDFSGSIVTAARNVVTLKFSGSGASGILPVIDDKATNTTFAGEVVWHRMSRGSERLRYDAASCTKYKVALAKATTARARIAREPTPLESAVRKREAADRVLLFEQLRASADSIQGALPRVRSRPDTTWHLARAVELRARADSVSTEIELAQSQAAPDSVAVLMANNERILAEQKAESELAVTGFHLHWWSFGIGLRNNSFKHFSAARPFDEQIAKRQFLSEEASVQLSFLTADTLGSRALRLLSFGVAGSRTDNFGSLAPITLTEVTQYGSTVDQRSSTRTTKAMTGDYETGIVGARLYSDSYQFFRRNNTLGFHLFPELRLLESTRGRVNVGIGIIAVAKNPKDNTVRVNVEPYWLLNDLAHRSNSIRSVVGASQFGFRFTLPFTFQPPE